MKNLILAAVLLLLTARVAQAQSGLYDFKAYSWANYGSPFIYRPTTADDLNNALAGHSFNFSDGTAKLSELFQIGQTSWSDEYDVGGGLHVKFSAEAVHHPPEPLSTAAPGIGAKAFASNNRNPGAATVIGESYVYLKDTVSVRNFTDRDHLLKSYDVTYNLDGFVDVSGDAIVQVGMAFRMTADAVDVAGNPLIYGLADIRTLQETPGPFGTVINSFNYGQPVPFSDPPLEFTSTGPYGGPSGVEIIDHGIHQLTVESLLYVRAQTGGLNHGAGTANANFSNTMRVANIRFFDENDQVIPGLQVVGANGDIYPYNVVPEPSVLTLFGVGSIGLLFARFRRTQRS